MYGLKIYEGQILKDGITGFELMQGLTSYSNFGLRIQDFYTDGIVNPDYNTPFELYTFLNNSIDVGEGTAYFNKERISIEGLSLYSIGSPLKTVYNVSTPESCGNIGITSFTTVPGLSNYVYIKYLETVDDSYVRTHSLSGLTYFVKKEDGYDIKAFRSSNTQPEEWDFVNGSWEAKTSCTVAALIYFAASFGTKVYLGISGPSDEIIEYDILTDTWTEKGVTPQTPQYGIALNIEGRIFVLFWDGSSFFYEYLPSSDTWVPLTAPLVALRGMGFSIDNKGYFGEKNGTNNFQMYDPITDTWTAKTSLPIRTNYHTASFSIGGKGYVKEDNGTDFYEYDPITDAWTAKASYPEGSQYSSGFSIKEKGYVGCNNDELNHFYEYDVISNTWRQLDNVGGTGRQQTSTFVIDNKGYVAGGWHGVGAADDELYCWTVPTSKMEGNWVYLGNSRFTTNFYVAKTNLPTAHASGNMSFAINDNIYVYFADNDFRMYNPNTNTWTSKTALNDGIFRWSGACFSVNGKGYIGLGHYFTGVDSRNFYEYDPDVDTWTYKTTYPGTRCDRVTCFVINNKAYIGFGYDNTSSSNNFYEYNPSTNIWTQKSRFEDPAEGQYVLVGCKGFSIGTKGYIGPGYFKGEYKKSFWEYNSITDEWIQKTDFPGIARNECIMLNVGNRGIVGMGGDGTPVGSPYLTYSIDHFFKDFYIYEPLTNTWFSLPDYTEVLYRMFSIQIDSGGFIGGGNNSSSYKEGFYKINFLSNYTNRLKFERKAI